MPPHPSALAKSFYQYLLLAGVTLKWPHLLL